MNRRRCHPLRRTAGAPPLETSAESTSPVSTTTRGGADFACKAAVPSGARFPFVRDGAIASRARVTASRMSSAVRSSSASFARTASARWLRNGVTTSWPSRVATARDSTGPGSPTVLPGSVNGFLVTNPGRHRRWFPGNRASPAPESLRGRSFGPSYCLSPPKKPLNTCVASSPVIVPPSSSAAGP